MGEPKLVYMNTYSGGKKNTEVVDSPGNSPGNSPTAPLLATKATFLDSTEAIKKLALEYVAVSTGELVELNKQILLLNEKKDILDKRKVFLAGALNKAMMGMGGGKMILNLVILVGSHAIFWAGPTGPILSSSILRVGDAKK